MNKQSNILLGMMTATSIALCSCDIGYDSTDGHYNFFLPVGTYKLTYTNVTPLAPECQALFSELQQATLYSNGKGNLLDKNTGVVSYYNISFVTSTCYNGSYVSNTGRTWNASWDACKYPTDTTSASFKASYNSYGVPIYSCKADGVLQKID